ncbi:MAG TPA: DUF72 domain-containing protein [Longimicrobiales bacterium]|nr:DUF72 domain-containing protein [Longimicrobiales bacterium]
MDAQLGLFDDEPTPGVTPVAPAPVPEDLASVAARLPAGLRLGTSSWSFPGWSGLVYDRKASETTLARYGLAAYARHPLLRTVGLDRGFYRPVPLEDFQRYAEAVPDDFRFLVKADRLLTYPTDPGSGGFRGSNPHFLDATYAIEAVVGPMMEGLGSKAGPLLFQFPPLAPNLVGGPEGFVQRLHRFLDALPPGPLYSVELRTPALLTPEYVQALEGVRAAHCYTVHPAMSPLGEQLRAVRPFEQPALVVRWMLHAGLRYEAAKDRYEPFDRIVDEDPDSRERITLAAFDALIAERAVFVVVNNKAEGSSPLSVFHLARRLAAWEPREGAATPAGPA